MNSEPVNAYPTIRSILLALLLVAFFLGVGHLFVLRFETGDVYPAYSSLRSDPLGTRVLYESLKNLADLSPRRNYHFLHSLKPEPDTTFFYLGTSADDHHPVPKELIEVFDRLAQSGGRLVVSFLPMKPKWSPEAKPQKEPESQKIENVRYRQESDKNSRLSVKRRWGVDFEFNRNLPVKDGRFMALDALSNRPDLPPAISWHSNLYFVLLDEDWQVLYTCEGRPVIIERPFGRGSLVLCADSFFISNEALQSERQPQLLAWLLGCHSNIVFDEAHFGIYKQPSVATLLRHYRFYRVLGVLAVLAVLFVWKNAVYFVPPRKEDLPTGTDVISDKDYTQGLITMLRRNIPGSDILRVCGQEWERTFKNDKRVQPKVFERVKEILRTQAPSAKKRVDVDAVNGYRKISRAVQRTKRYE